MLHYGDIVKISPDIVSSPVIVGDGYISKTVFASSDVGIQNSQHWDQLFIILPGAPKRKHDKLAELAEHLSTLREQMANGFRMEEKDEIILDIMNLAVTKEREENEATTKASLRQPVKYKDNVEFMHLCSGLFLAMGTGGKDPATYGRRETTVSVGSKAAEVGLRRGVSRRKMSDADQRNINSSKDEVVVAKLTHRSSEGCFSLWPGMNLSGAGNADADDNFGGRVSAEPIRTNDPIFVQCEGIAGRPFLGLGNVGASSKRWNIFRKSTLQSEIPVDSAAGASTRSSHSDGKTHSQGSHHRKAGKGSKSSDHAAKANTFPLETRQNRDDACSTF